MSLEGKWVVDTLAVGGELVPPLEGTRPTLEVDGDRVGGNATINRFMGSMGDDALFGPMATTMMAGPSDHMAQEQLYLSHLGKADSFEVVGEDLDLISDDLVVVTLRRPGT